MLRKGFGGAHLLPRRLQPTPAPPVADPSPPITSDPDDEDDDEDDDSHTDPLDPGPPVSDGDSSEDDASSHHVDDTPQPDLPVLDEGDADSSPTEEEDDDDAADTPPSLPTPDPLPDTGTDPPDTAPDPDPDPPDTVPDDPPSTVPDTGADPPSTTPDPDPDDEEDDEDDVSHSDPLDPGPPVLDSGDEDETSSESDGDDAGPGPPIITPGPPVLDSGDEDETSSESSNDDPPPVTPTFETPLHTVYTFNGSQSSTEWTGDATVVGSKIPINVEIGTDWTLIFDLKPGAPKNTDEYYLSITTPTYGNGLYFHSLYLSTIGAYSHNFRSKWVNKDFGLDEVPEWTNFQTVRIENDHTGTCVYRNGVEVASFSAEDVDYEKSHIFLGSMFLYEDGDGYAGKRTYGTQMRNIKFFNYLLTASQRAQLAQNQWYV